MNWDSVSLIPAEWNLDFTFWFFFWFKTNNNDKEQVIKYYCTVFMIPFFIHFDLTAWMLQMILLLDGILDVHSLNYRILRNGKSNANKPPNKPIFFLTWMNLWERTHKWIFCFQLNFFFWWFDQYSFFDHIKDELYIFFQFTIRIIARIRTKLK